MESVSGTAQDPATRGRTNDPDKLGKFGMWIGRGPDGHHSWLLEQGAGEALTRDYGAGMVSLAAQGMSNGLGQMGAAHSRPGMPGTPGFYLQLSFWNQTVAERNADYVANAGGTMDPISGVFNQFNPVTVLALAAHNVEVGSRVYGYDRGNLIEAQGVSWMDNVMPAIGKAIDKSIGTLLWGQAPAAELVGEFLSAGISSNAQTGEYGFAMNERAWMEFATEAAATMASYGYDMPAGPTQTILQIANAGMQYDKAGRITGYDAGSITTADIGGALVTTMASHYSISESDMNYGSDFATVFGQEYARTKHNNVIGAASGWANRQLGSENRLIQQFGVQGALMGYNAVKGLFDSDTAPESPETRASREANQNDQNRRTAGFFQGWQFWREAEQAVEVEGSGALGLNPELDAKIQKWMRGGMSEEEAMATLNAGQNGAAGSWNHSVELARELRAQGLSRAEAMAQTAREQGISLDHVGEGDNPKRILGRDAAHKAEVAKNQAEQAYQQMSAVFAGVFNGQNSVQPASRNAVPTGQRRYIRDTAIGQYAQDLSPRLANGLRYLYGKSETIQRIDQEYSSEMYKAENRFKQPLLEGIERFPRFSESFSPSELIDDLQTWHTEMVQSSGATSLFGFRSEYAFFVGGAYGAGIAIHYGRRKYDGTFMSNFDMYDYSIYAYSADTRGFKGEVSLEAAQLQGVRDRHELEDALTHSVSIPTRTIIGVTPYYREPIKPDDPGNQSNWFHSQSNRVGWGLSVGAALGASYQSYSFDWTWEDTTAFDKKWPVFILGPVALGMYMASMTENETGVW